MLRICYGADWQGTSDAILETICANAEQGLDGQVLIVPEQFSFDAEWRLCRRGGDRISRFAEVLSFTRLYDRICERTGGAAEQTMDRAGRLIAMAGALEQVRSRLKVYGMHTTKPEFLQSLLSLYEEFRSCGVNAQALEAAFSSVGGQLAEKLEELQLIFESYESVCANAAHDPATRLSRLADKLYESDYAQDRRILIEGFSDFTAQELDVIAALLASGAELTVGLCCDDLHAGQEIFSVTRETARQLCKLADTVELDRISPLTRQPAMNHLRRWLFAGGTEVYPDAAPLAMGERETPYAQALSAAAQLQALERDGVRWREMAVACTDAAQFQPILERVFYRYRIPGYFAGTKELPQTPVVRMLLSALRAASGRMEAEDVLDYLKSGAAPLTREQSDALENYAIVWKLSGAGWGKPFENDPAGYGSHARTEEFAAALDQLNASRRAAVEPLWRLRQALAASENTGRQILALDRFLEEIDLAARLARQAEALQAAGDFRRAQQTAQIYDGILDTMEQIYGVLGDTVRTPEEFYQFFRAALSQNSVGTIPATLDCVHVGSLRDLRNSRAPYLILLGASDGMLPMRSQQTGLLSSQDRRRLKHAGFPLAPDSDAQLARELLVAYTVLTSCTSGLYLLCQKDEPSYLYTRLQTLFPAAGTLPEAPLPASELQAAAALAGCDANPEDPALQQAAALFRQRAAYDPGVLTRQTVEGLYGRTMYLSASRVDRFASCHMAFFLRYGLKAMERKPAEVDAPLFGTFVHYVLEHTARRVMREGDFHSITPERLEELAKEAIDAFVRTELTGFETQPERAQYLFRRSFDEVMEVVRELGNELRTSKFEPAAFELPFSDESAVAVEGKTARATMSGFVDRVDCYDAPDGRRYARVVDYKTGRKDFDYTDILSGIGLQMLIYLFALQKQGKQLLGQAVEGAGVLYFPARVDVLSNTSRLTPEETEKKRREAFRRKGLLLNDDGVLRAMEDSEQPVYLPCKPDRGGKRQHLADAAQFDALEQFVFLTLGEMTDELYRGAARPNPYRRGDHTPCQYCEFRAVCHVAGGAVEERILAETTEERFWQEVERRNAHG